MRRRTYNSTIRSIIDLKSTTPSNTYCAFRSKEDRHPHSGLAALALRKDAMPKPAVVRRASRRQVTARPGDLPNVVEGQIAEICRDLAVEATTGRNCSRSWKRQTSRRHSFTPRTGYGLQVTTLTQIWTTQARARNRRGAPWACRRITLTRAGRAPKRIE
jgi:hypothetical protein